MFFNDIAEYVSKVFDPRFLKFVTAGSYPLAQPDEIRFFLDDIGPNLPSLSLILKPSSKYIIAVQKKGFSFYLIDEIKHSCFIGSKLNTHVHYILSSAEISYLHGHLSAIYQKGNN